MPKIRPGMRPPPKGFDVVSDALDAFEQQMKDAVNDTADGKGKGEAMWAISSINFRRTRHLFDLCFKTKEISREVLDYCAAMGFIDAGLVKRWRIPGYERLCCVTCVTPSATNSGGSCVCRVPPGQRRVKGGPCKICGCTGCCSGAKKSAPPQDESLPALAPEPKDGDLFPKGGTT